MQQASGIEVTELRVDGGASVMDVLCQFQADQIRVPVRRAAIAESTALGAAYLAGLAEGVWSSTQELALLWQASGEFSPKMSARESDHKFAGWRRALERTLA
jgi:glycerol kinase